jgi:hypothetical protein
VRRNSCAGAYVSGAAGSNVCPAGSVRIETLAACRTAATVVGKAVNLLNSAENNDGYPRGCYYNIVGNSVQLNNHPVGTGQFANQLLCAAVTTGALLARTDRASVHGKDRDR